VRGTETIFSFPHFGLIPFERLTDLFETLLGKMGLDTQTTLGEFEQLVGK